MKVYDVRGNLVQELGPNGGVLSGKHVGKLTAVVVNGGKVLGHKSFVYTGF